MSNKGTISHFVKAYQLESIEDSSFSKTGCIVGWRRNAQGESPDAYKDLPEAPDLHGYVTDNEMIRVIFEQGVKDFDNLDDIPGFTVGEANEGALAYIVYDSFDDKNLTELLKKVIDIPNYSHFAKWLRRNAMKMTKKDMFRVVNCYLNKTYPTNIQGKLKHGAHILKKTGNDPTDLELIIGMDIHGHFEKNQNITDEEKIRFLDTLAAEELGDDFLRLDFGHVVTYFCERITSELVDYMDNYRIQRGKGDSTVIVFATGDSELTCINKLYTRFPKNCRVLPVGYMFGSPQRASHKENKNIGAINVAYGVDVARHAMFNSLSFMVEEEVDPRHLHLLSDIQFVEGVNYGIEFNATKKHRTFMENIMFEATMNGIKLAPEQAPVTDDSPQACIAENHLIPNGTGLIFDQTMPDPTGVTEGLVDDQLKINRPVTTIHNATHSLNNE
jgi:hypothetical protein